MIAAIAIGLRASVVVLAALAAAVLLRKRPASLRHWILAAGLFAAAIVAPLSYVLPAWDLPGRYAFTRDEPPPPHGGVATIVSMAPIEAGAPTRAQTAPERFPVERAVNVFWLGGFAIALAILIGRIIRIAYVTRRAVPVVDARWQSHVPSLKTSLPGVVGTWGWRRPCLLLPPDCESWSDDRIRVVLGHELAHIRRNDWIIQVATTVVAAAFWYNPLFWMASARLRREGEQAADDLVLEAGVPAAEYASHLLDLARAYRAPAAALLPVARPSTLEWRIAAMLNASSIRRRPTRRSLALAAAIIAGVALSASSFRAATAVQPMPLTGTVYDMTGAVLPAAELTLDSDTGTHLSTTTDRNGHFDFGVTAPGKYSLRSELIGFSTMKQEVTLDDERSFTRSITLQVGTLQETITVREQRRAGMAAALGPVHIGGNLRAPTKVKDVRPIYPPEMRDAGLEGVVPLGAVIDAEGRVTSVRGISASAHPEFTQAAIAAVRQWVFTPTLLNGQPVEVFMTVTVTFSLED